MTGSTKHIPEGYHSVTPYLYMNEAARAIEFYKEVFGATELFRFDAPGGKIGHAEIKIGDSHVMLADEGSESDERSPQTVGGTPVGLLLYVEDVDAVAENAVAAGAKMLNPLEDKFYGDRMGKLQDPFGHIWAIATHKEDVSPEEMQERVAALQG
ncbi:MAG TPA: VOC family protein [Pyrinomonadaceae bacterium]|jgi:PhnB protein|nr:VOC family protein [Pyrinomonadaceae bacterium]